MSTIRASQELIEKTRAYLLGRAPFEQACLGLVGWWHDGDDTHFIIREVIFPTEDDYDVVEELRIQLKARFMNKVIGKAEAEGLGIVMMHSHPFARGSVSYSYADDFGEGRSSRTFFECLGSDVPVASLVFGEDCIAGRYWQRPSEMQKSLNELRLVGRKIRFIPLGKAEGRRAEITREIFDRPILAFGETGQQLLHTLRIAVVGSGRTGSSTAEQIVRLGVRKPGLVDHDHFEPSNLVGVYGSFHRHLEQNPPIEKVAMVAEHLREIFPDLEIDVIAANVFSTKVLNRLRTYDIIFSCVDRHVPRSVLNELSYQYGIPIIDVGAGLDPGENQRIKGGTVRATIIGLGLPCLFCCGAINPDIIAAELLPPEEQKARLLEGYVPGLGKAASVINYTTLAAALGTTLFTDALFMDREERLASNIIFDLGFLKTLRVTTHVREDCTCLRRAGRGGTVPFSAPE